jgi:hypothetical protein
MDELPATILVSAPEDVDFGVRRGFALFVINMSGNGCGGVELNPDARHLLARGKSEDGAGASGPVLTVSLAHIAIALNRQIVSPGIKALDLKASHGVGRRVAAWVAAIHRPDPHFGLSQGFARAGPDHNTLNCAQVGRVLSWRGSVLGGTGYEQEQGKYDSDHAEASV